ncbi:hypothetical protein BDD12DRAFT_938664 [Trichophaea hybrida]|nr:hypothetical protein BDD12DRAFT_938664 [Trichophaea hybrida]
MNWLTTGSTVYIQFNYLTGSNQCTVCTTMNFPSPALTLAHCGDLKDVWREISPVTSVSSPFKSLSEESLKQDIWLEEYRKRMGVSRLSGREKKRNILSGITIKIIRNGCALVQPLGGLLLGDESLFIMPMGTRSEVQADMIVARREIEGFPERYWKSWNKKISMMGGDKRHILKQEDEGVLRRIMRVALRFEPEKMAIAEEIVAMIPVSWERMNEKHGLIIALHFNKFTLPRLFPHECYVDPFLQRWSHTELCVKPFAGTQFSASNMSSSKHRRLYVPETSRYHCLTHCHPDVVLQAHCRDIRASPREYLNFYKVDWLGRHLVRVVSRCPLFDRQQRPVFSDSQVLRLKNDEKREEENGLSTDTREGRTVDLYTKERRKTTCRLPKPEPSTSAESSSSAWGHARPMGADEAGEGR